MTIQQLIDKVQEEKPNSFSDDKIVSFVNEIEADVADQISVDFEDYTLDDKEEELIVPAPYNRLYVSYVKAQIDYANEEYPSYQLNAEQHVQDFTDFINWMVRTGQSDRTTLPSRFRNIF